MSADPASLPNFLPSELEARRCGSCRARSIPIDDPRPICRMCRESLREQNKLVKRPLTDRNRREENAMVVDSEISVKRKAAVEDDRIDVARMKKRFKCFFDENTGTSAITTSATIVPNSPSHGDFQTASNLYKQLKLQFSSASGSFQFHGWHSIITVPTIDNVKRLELVATDLKKIVKLPFVFDLPTTPVPALDRGKRIAHTFKCNCLATRTQSNDNIPSESSAAAANLKESAKLKRRQSDLLQWMTKSSSKSNEFTSELECKGQIVVTVEDDNSHSLGIKGQKITVTVEHGRD